MIKTRFGSPVYIVRGNMDTAEVDLWTLDDDGNRLSFFQTYTSELKADGGLAEIAAGIDEANNREQPDLS